MYLLVFCDGTSKQISENLTAADYLAASQKIIHIFRCRDSGFQKLVFDKTDAGVKPAWVFVLEGKTLSCPDGVVHS